MKTPYQMGLLSSMNPKNDPLKECTFSTKYECKQWWDGYKVGTKLLLMEIFWLRKRVTKS